MVPNPKTRKCEKEIKEETEQSSPNSGLRDSKRRNHKSTKSENLKHISSLAAAVKALSAAVVLLLLTQQSRALKVYHIMDYTLDPGYSFVKIFPSAPNSANPLITNGRGYKLISATSSTTSQNSKKNFEIRYRTQPTLFPIHYFNSQFIQVYNSKTTTFDLDEWDPDDPNSQQHDYLIKFSRIDIVVGNYIYGLDSAGKGVIWDNLVKTRIRNSSFTGRLDGDSCGFINFMRAFVCKINYTEYLEMPLEQDLVKKVYYNFQGSRPFSYQNRTILGCYADPSNVYCQFYNPRDNSSATFSLTDIHPFYYLESFKHSYLPIPELQILAVSLVNKTVQFFDLENSGKLLSSYIHGSNSNLIRPVFSNSSFHLSWQVDMNSMVVLKIPPRFNISGCPFYDYSWGRCVSCADGYKLSKTGAGCIRHLGNATSVELPKIGVVLPRKKWKIEKKDIFTCLKLVVKVDFGSFERERRFYEDFMVARNLIVSSDGLVDPYQFLEFRPVGSGNQGSLTLLVSFKRSMPRAEVEFALRDTPRNGNLNLDKDELNLTHRVPPVSENGLREASDLRRGRGIVLKNGFLLKILDFNNPKNLFKNHPELQESPKNSFPTPQRAHPYLPDLVTIPKKPKKKPLPKGPKIPKTHKITLPAVIVSEYTLTKLSYTFFYISRLLQILLCALLLIRPFSKTFKKVKRSLWLFNTVLLFQALSLFPYISVYYYRWFDQFIKGILEIFLRGYFELWDIHASPELSRAKYMVNMGKISEYDIDFTIINKMSVEAVVYGVLWVGSLLLALFRKGEVVSALRETVALSVMLPVVIYSSMSVNSFLFGGKKAGIYTLNSIASSSFCLLVIFDVLASFGAISYRDHSFRANLFPKQVCSYFVFSKVVFRSMEEVKNKFRGSRFYSIVGLCRWPIFGVLVGFFSSSQFWLSFLLLTWALAYFWVEFWMLTMQLFDQKIYALLGLLKELLLASFAVLTFLAALDYQNGIFGLWEIDIISFLLMTSYVLIWVVEFVNSLYILLEVVSRCSFWQMSEKTSKYLIDIDSTLDMRNLNTDFKETDEEKLMRQKVKLMDPYDFWVFVRSRPSNAPSKRSKSDCSSIYVQTTQRSGVRPLKEWEGRYKRMGSEQDVDKLSELLNTKETPQGRTHINESLRKQRELREEYERHIIEEEDSMLEESKENYKIEKELFGGGAGGERQKERKVKVQRKIFVHAGTFSENAEVDIDKDHYFGSQEDFGPGEVVDDGIGAFLGRLDEPTFADVQGDGLVGEDKENVDGMNFRGREGREGGRVGSRTPGKENRLMKDRAGLDIVSSLKKQTPGDNNVISFKNIELDVPKRESITEDNHLAPPQFI